MLNYFVQCYRINFRFCSFDLNLSSLNLRNIFYCFYFTNLLHNITYKLKSSFQYFTGRKKKLRQITNADRLARQVPRFRLNTFPQFISSNLYQLITANSNQKLKAKNISKLYSEKENILIYMILNINNYFPIKQS